MLTFLNIATRKVGGLRFVKIGRLTFSYSVAAEFVPFRDAAPRRPRLTARAAYLRAEAAARIAERNAERAYWDAAIFGADAAPK